MAFDSAGVSDAVAEVSVLVVGTALLYKLWQLLSGFAYCPLHPKSDGFFASALLLGFKTSEGIDEIKDMPDIMQSTQKCKGLSLFLCRQELLHLSYFSPSLTCTVVFYCPPSPVGCGYACFPRAPGPGLET